MTIDLKLNSILNKPPEIKLNIACGDDYLDGWVNVDLYSEKADIKFDVEKPPYPYEDNSIDEIKAFHIIEHFDFHSGNKVLAEWFRILKPGGRLWIETPDFLESCKEFVKTGDANLYGHFFATPWVPGQTHKFLFTENQLIGAFGWIGFVNAKRIPPSSVYINWFPPHIFLCMEAFKPL